MRVPCSAARPWPRPTNSVPCGPDMADSALDCPVCIDPMDPPVVLPCGHSGCKGCLVTWYATNPNCPVCLAQLDEVIKCRFQSKRAQINIQLQLFPSISNQISALNDLTSTTRSAGSRPAFRRSSSCRSAARCRLSSSRGSWPTSAPSRQRRTRRGSWS